MVPPLTLCAYMKKGPNLRWSLIQCSGGDEGDRTPDLLTASQALSQLSYAPVRRSTIRELPRRCKDNFGKTFCGGGEDAGRTRERGPAEPDPARGARPAGGGRRDSRCPKGAGEEGGGNAAIFRFRGAGRHPPNGLSAGAGPIIGGNRAPSGPAIPKTMPVYGARPETPEHAAIGKIKTAGRRLTHSAKCRVWTAGPGPAP